ncbi:flagellar transcriptional regulator FlhD [Salmonella enterica]|nr:flagellar transcriptional regulator FlhD [Salmonella enterica]EKC2694438.1 flagellar transcriptional regulator FlhD [Salmonella enterica]
MNTEQSLYEMNYTWLSLAQKMLLKDKSVAMFRLGLNARVDHLAPMHAAMLCLSDTGGRYGI